MRPPSITSNGGACTFAPSSFARSATASALSTDTYEFHSGGTPASRCCSGCGAIAATGLPSISCIEYTASSPIGLSSACQPSRPA